MSTATLNATKTASGLLNLKGINKRSPVFWGIDALKLQQQKVFNLPGPLEHVFGLCSISIALLDAFNSRILELTTRAMIICQRRAFM